MKAESFVFEHFTLVAHETPDEFPLGRRGVYPVALFLSTNEAADRVKAARIPGTRVFGNRVDTTWDGAAAVANALSDHDPVEPKVAPAAFQVLNTASQRLSKARPIYKGKPRYDGLPLKGRRRDAQAYAMVWLSKLSYSVLADPPRAGKTLPLLGTVELLGAQKCLIVSPALPKLVWVGEIGLWTKEPAIVLYGRGGTEAFAFCPSCYGGLAPSEFGDGVCPTCNGEGGTVYQLGSMELVDERVPYAEVKTLKSGKTKTVTKYAKAVPIPVTFRCSRHQEYVTPRRDPCPHCREEMLGILSKFRYVIANYDILYAHIEENGRGVQSIRYDLPGWNPTLSAIKWDIALLDEAHRVRVWKTKNEGGETNPFLRRPNKRDALKALLHGVPRVIASTATPTCGFVRDYWGLLDLISDGLWS